MATNAHQTRMVGSPSAPHSSRNGFGWKVGAPPRRRITWAPRKAMPRMATPTTTLARIRPSSQALLDRGAESTIGATRARPSRSSDSTR